MWLTRAIDYRQDSIKRIRFTFTPVRRVGGAVAGVCHAIDGTIIYRYTQVGCT